LNTFFFKVEAAVLTEIGSWLLRNFTVSTFYNEKDDLMYGFRIMTEFCLLGL